MNVEISLSDADVNRIADALEQRRKAREPNDGERLLTVATLAEYLSVKPEWVYERTHGHEIPYFKVGKFPRFRKSEIDKWLASQSRACTGSVNLRRIK
ncbi:MAG: helix-turn-helix domain-containing protein [Acidobacteriota bacterium]